MPPSGPPPASASPSFDRRGAVPWARFDISFLRNFAAPPPRGTATSFLWCPAQRVDLRLHCIDTPDQGIDVAAPRDAELSHRPVRRAFERAPQNGPLPARVGYELLDLESGRADGTRFHPRALLHQLGEGFARALPGLT